MGLLADFHRNVSEKCLNATFISLLPKMAGVYDMKQFRPISFVGSVNKILTKILASRLRKVIGKSVGPRSHAFIKGHQILDASLIVNECINSYLKLKQPGVLSKLNIEAFDHGTWDFLIVILEKMGFPSKWRRWVFFAFLQSNFRS